MFKGTLYGGVEIQTTDASPPPGWLVVPNLPRSMTHFGQGKSLVEDQ